MEKNKTLRLTEIFYSLQGETNTVGLPTVFIRLTGCPLRCSYCDTAYAFSGGKTTTISTIINKVDQYKTKYVTVTGGEPLAQPACYDLLTTLINNGYIVSLETSGAMDISGVDQRVVRVMDIKTPGSEEVDKNIFQNIEYLTEKDQVKFVIADQIDYQWSKSIVDKYQLSNRCEVLFSPVSGIMNPVELAENIIQDKLSVRFQIQLHKYLWGEAQGK